jgi:hypothetical protein
MLLKLKRLYDRLFIDEARTAIKKNFEFKNSNSLEIERLQNQV